MGGIREVLGMYYGGTTELPWTYHGDGLAGLTMGDGNCAQEAGWHLALPGSHKRHAARSVSMLTQTGLYSKLVWHERQPTKPAACSRGWRPRQAPSPDAAARAECEYGRELRAWLGNGAPLLWLGFLSQRRPVGICRDILVDCLDRLRTADLRGLCSLRHSKDGQEVHYLAPHWLCRQSERHETDPVGDAHGLWRRAWSEPHPAIRAGVADTRSDQAARRAQRFIQHRFARH